MDNEEKFFGLMEKMYSEMQNGFKKVNLELQQTKNELQEVKKTVVRIENDHGQKLGALFDGHKLNSEKLDRIEAEVS